MPADKPTIKDLTTIEQAEPPRLASNQAPIVGPHNENSKLVLSCETQGGYPEPQLTWWRNGQLVDDSYEVVSALDNLVLARHPGSFGSAPDKLSADSTNDDSLIVRGGDNNGPNGNELARAEPASGSPDPEGPDEPDREAAGQRQQVVTQSQNLNNNNQNRLIRNKLELGGLTRADLMANYSCQAWNTKLSEAPTTSVMIDMNRK